MNRTDERLRQSLRAYAANISAAATPPEASLVWLRAERRRRLLAIQRAERPLRIMQAIGVACATLAAIWLLLRSGALRQLPAAGTTILVLAIACPLLVIAGFSTLLLASRRPLA